MTRAWMLPLGLGLAACGGGGGGGGDGGSGSGGPSCDVAIPQPVTVTEGGTTTLWVDLATKPMADVNITLAVDDATTATISPATAAVSPASAAQFTVTGVDDGKTNSADRGARYTAAAAGCAANAMSGQLYVVDRTTQNIVASNWNLRIPPSGTGTFSATLTQAPTATVTVQVAAMSPGIVAPTPQQLTFTASDYSSPHTVTVLASGLGATVIKLLPDSGIGPQGVEATVSSR